MKILSANEMRKLDEAMMRECGISQEILMENAALGAYYFLRKRSLHSIPALIFCGPGNNGGDGLALARKIFSHNKDVKIILTHSPEGYSGAALKNYSIVRKLGIPILGFDELTELMEKIKEKPLIVDALLGTGLNSHVRGPIKEVIEFINTTEAYVVSLDIPSGLSSDTGLPLVETVASDFTVSFGYPKLGHFLGHGKKYIPTLASCNISIGSEFVRDIKTLLNLPAELPPRNPVGHKGSFGKALFISGCDSYLGAPYFNAYSFIQCGGGYSTLYSTWDVIRSVAPSAREVVFKVGRATPSGSLSRDNLKALLQLSTPSDITAIGSGLSLDPSTVILVLEFSSDYRGTLIIDGDALTAVKNDLDILRRRWGTTILTPHLGEFSSLTGLSVEEIVSDRVEILRSFAKQYNSYVVLKDTTTLIASPAGDILINPTGNSGLGVAGSGDILVGTLAAALASFDLPPLEAASLGVFIHGMAADMLMEEVGAEGVTPTKLLDILPLAIKKFRENYIDIIKNYTPELL